MNNLWKTKARPGVRVPDRACVVRGLGVRLGRRFPSYRNQSTVDGVNGIRLSGRPVYGSVPGERVSSGKAGRDNVCFGKSSENLWGGVFHDQPEECGLNAVSVDGRAPYAFGVGF